MLLRSRSHCDSRLRRSEFRPCLTRAAWPVVLVWNGTCLAKRNTHTHARTHNASVRRVIRAPRQRGLRAAGLAVGRWTPATSRRAGRCCGCPPRRNGPSTNWTSCSALVAASARTCSTALPLARRACSPSSRVAFLAKVCGCNAHGACMFSRCTRITLVPHNVTLVCHHRIIAPVRAVLSRCAARATVPFPPRSQTSRRARPALRASAPGQRPSCRSTRCPGARTRAWQTWG
jgi:hypothetical protein